MDRKLYDLIESNPQKYAKDYRESLEKVKNSSAYYKGEPVPFLSHPMLWEERDIEAFKYIARMITQITDKLTDKYIEDEAIRKIFDYPPLSEQLILRKKGYKRHAPIGRYDIFYNSPEDFKFCEINTDGSSAMNEDNTIGNILLDSNTLKDFQERENIILEGFELINSWVDCLLEYYIEWGGDDAPTVAICDFIESGTSSEFEVFKDRIKERGLECFICDPRDTVYREGRLFYKEMAIDLLYRRIVTFELLEKAEEIKDFIDAYMDNAMCTVGEVRSQIMHHKKSFEILLNPEVAKIFNEEEREFIKNHFPHTETLSLDSEQIERVKQNKDDFVLKPYDKNASQGVFIGRTMSYEEWERIVGEVKGTGYLVQEFVMPNQRWHTVFKGDTPTLEKLYSIVGLFLYDGEFKGIYTRVSSDYLISGITNYYTLPNFLVRRND